MGSITKIHGVAIMVAPGLGSIALTNAGNALAPIAAMFAAKVPAARGMQLPHPGPARFPAPAPD